MITSSNSVRKSQAPHGKSIPWGHQLSRTVHPAIPQKLIRNSVSCDEVLKSLTRLPVRPDPCLILYDGASPVNGGLISQPVAFQGLAAYVSVEGINGSCQHSIKFVSVELWGQVCTLSSLSQAEGSSWSVFLMWQHVAGETSVCSRWFGPINECRVPGFIRRT